MKLKPISCQRPNQPKAKVREATSNSWFKIVNHNTNEADLYIYDEIGYWGVTASDLLNQLAELQASTINVRINSPGGDVFDGIAIFNALLSHPATVNTTVDALAASAASFIAMAGDTLTMAPHSQMMIHDASGITIGNAADMRQMADLLDRLSNEIASMYAERAGGTTDTWREAMRAESWYGAQEAVDAGLADAVGPTPNRGQQTDEPVLPDEATAKWDLSIFTYAGRESAPTPYVPAAQESATPEFDPENFRAAVRALRPVASIADQLRSAYKEASK